MMMMSTSASVTQQYSFVLVYGVTSVMVTAKLVEVTYCWVYH